MNKEKLIVKVACLIGYVVFASFSAYFTASSLSLNLLNGTNLWIVFVLVFIVSILAGWCLSNVLAEARNTLNPSKSRFLVNLSGFVIFWMFSFLTNVHYFFVEKHGYNILVKELTGAKTYIADNTSKSNRQIDDQKNVAQQMLVAQVQANVEAFHREILNTMQNQTGFAEACISILKSTESILQKDAKVYGDNNLYVIFDDKRDMGDRGTTLRSRLPQLQIKYTARIQEALNKKLAVIENYYERRKNNDAQLLELLDPINELSDKHLPEVEKDGSVNAFYAYHRIQDSRVIAKMPQTYHKQASVVKDGEVKEYRIYPSSRMFDTMSVWNDIIHSRVTDMTMVQWIIIALIFDIVAFILFAAFRKPSF